MKMLQHGSKLTKVLGVRALSSSPLTIKSGRGGRSSTNAKTVTIFGATGKMGRYLVNNLGQLGTQMIIPHRCDPVTAQYLKVSSDLGQQHQVYTPDFNDEEQLMECVKYSDVVVNLTGVDKIKLHQSWMDGNVTLTHKIARACKKMEVPCFIHMSHINADIDSPSQFLKTKALSEEVVLHELPDAAIIIRASDCFHARDKFTHYLARINSVAKLFEKGRTPLYKKGLDTYKTPVYGPDVFRGITNIISMNDTERERLYQFVGPRTYSLHELMTSITDITFRQYRPVVGRYNFLWNKYLLRSEPYIRHQMTSDNVALGLPGLEDVGITPTQFEDKALFWLRSYRIFWQVWDPVDGQKTNIYGNVMGTGENM